MMALEGGVASKRVSGWRVAGEWAAGSNYLQQHVSVRGFGALPRLRLGDHAREFAVDAG